MAIPADLKEQILSLSQEDRGELISWAIQSLKLDAEAADSPEEVEAAWLDVAERRLREIKDGAAELVSGEELFEKLNRKRGYKIQAP